MKVATGTDSPDARFRLALSRVVVSESFLRSPALGRLLTYLVEQVISGQAASLKETVIGHELYGRPAVYDPKEDSVVRVTANRLRARLEDHYRDNPGEQAQIVLPRGSYVPQLQIRPDLSECEEREQGAQEVFRDPVGPAALELEIPSQTEQVEAGPSSPGHRRSPFYRPASIAASFALLLACTLFWFYPRHSPGVTSNTMWSARPFARLGGSQRFGAFSPDGATLAFTSISAQGGYGAIYIQSVTSENPQRIASGVRPSWSPDAHSLAFVRPEANGRKKVILHSLTTGTESELAEFDSLGPWLCQIPRLSWSKDGKTLYTTAILGKSSSCGLVAIDIMTHRVRPLLAPVTLVGDLEPAVSPDGSQIAFLRGLGIGGPDLFLMSSHGGEARRFTHDGADIVGFDWSADGKALIVASNRESGTRKLWRFPREGGPPEALTDGVAEPTLPAVSADGKQINFTQFRVTAPIWRSESGRTTELLDNQSRNNAPSLSPDGKTMLYTSNRAGRITIWLSKADGTSARPLLPENEHETGSARWSPDGRRIVFECQLAMKTHVCISDADGKNLHNLNLGDASQVMPSWSHDGSSVYFTSESSGSEEIYRVDLPSGAVVRVTYQGGLRALEAPDGKWLYVARGRPYGGVTAIPLQGTERERRDAEGRTLLPKVGIEAGRDWDVGRDGLFYLTPGDQTSLRLNFFNIGTQKSRVLRTVEAAGGTDFSMSMLPDGEGVIYTAEQTYSDLSIMSARK